MGAGVQAKMTDFGTFKLASVNSRMTSLALCPGNVLYMSPEALMNSLPTPITRYLFIWSSSNPDSDEELSCPGPRIQVVDDPRFFDGLR